MIMIVDQRLQQFSNFFVPTFFINQTIATCTVSAPFISIKVSFWILQSVFIIKHSKLLFMLIIIHMFL